MRVEDAAELRAIAIVCLTVALICSWIFGIDRGVTVTIIAIIAGLAGYELGRNKDSIVKKLKEVARAG